MEWRVRVAMAPLWALFLSSLVVGGSAFAVAVGGGGEAFLEGLAVGTGVAVVVTALTAVARRGERSLTGIGPADRRAALRAMFTGDAPADTSLDDRLLAMAARRRRALGVLRWAFGAIALLRIIPAVARPRPSSITLLVLWTVLATATWLVYVHDAPRLARLERTLRARSK